MKMSFYSHAYEQKNVSTSQHAVRAQKAGGAARFATCPSLSCELMRSLLYGHAGQGPHGGCRRWVISRVELGGHIEEDSK